MDEYSVPKADRMGGPEKCFVPEKDSNKARERQREKIKEIGDPLCREGYVSLDQQARVLGLCRSTTWAILQANHKSGGLTATIINRMLAAREIPPSVRVKILEYVEAKAAGLYGHPDRLRRNFTERLSPNALPGQEHWPSA